MRIPRDASRLFTLHHRSTPISQSHPTPDTYVAHRPDWRTIAREWGAGGGKECVRERKHATSKPLRRDA